MFIIIIHINNNNKINLLSSGENTLLSSIHIKTEPSHYCYTMVLLIAEAGVLTNCRLLKSSAANNCQTLMMNLSIKANSVDPEQTAPIGAV